MDSEYDVGTGCVWSEEINCVRRGGSALPPRLFPDLQLEFQRYALILLSDTFAGIDVAVLGKPMCIAVWNACRNGGSAAKP
jgi:hypothetical protein